MEFDIETFTTRLRELMYDSPYFPYLAERGKNRSGSFKHKLKNNEIKNVAFKTNPTLIVGDMRTFDIGNSYAEAEYPYYHILEDAPAIRKRGKGTKKTKGSQATITKSMDRDYNIVSWNGKTFTKEYARNVRGKRNRLSNVSHWATDYNGDLWFINRNAGSYKNEHYHYIERMLNNGILDAIATEFGLTRKRTVDTGLKEEYISQYYDIENYSSDSGIIDMIQSFMQ